MTKHTTVKININGHEFDVDKKLEKIIYALNSKEIYTKLCCESNLFSQDNKEYVWIEFYLKSYTKLIRLAFDFRNNNNLWQWFKDNKFVYRTDLDPNIHNNKIYFTVGLRIPVNMFDEFELLVLTLLKLQ